MSKKMVWVCFLGNSVYKNSIGRLRNECNMFPIQLNAIGNDESYLQTDLQFWKQHQNHFFTYGNRAYTYGVWKPYYILKMLSSLKENDILLYIDAGCTLNSNGKNRFQTYLEIMQDHDLLAFNMPHLPEYKYTKKSVVENLECTIQDKQSGQYLSGIHFWKNNEKSRLFLSKWYDLCCSNNYENIIDSVGEDHRHNQSVFSIMCKQNEFCLKIQTLADETYPQSGKFKDILHFPIWATRKK